MSTHNICFYGELTKIILQLSSNTLRICSPVWGWDGCFECYLLHISKNRFYCDIFINEPPHDNKMTCAPSKDSDQPEQLPSLIRVFAVCMKKSWVLSYPLRSQQRQWSDWVDAQADQSSLGAQVILLVLSCGAQIWINYTVTKWLLTEVNSTRVSKTCVTIGIVWLLMLEYRLTIYWGKLHESIKDLCYHRYRLTVGFGV